MPTYAFAVHTNRSRRLGSPVLTGTVHADSAESARTEAHWRARHYLPPGARFHVTVTRVRLDHQETTTHVHP